MKLTYKILPLLAFAAFANCESVVEDLNIDPNNFQDISTDLIINHSVLNLASVQEGEPARIAGMWSDQFTGSDRQYVTQDNYDVTDADFNTIWADIYRDGLTQTLIARDKAAEAGPAVIGVTEILQAYYGAEAALMFGDVPFSDVNNPDNPDPAFEPQEQVIMEAISLLDSGREKARQADGSSFPITFQNQVLTSTSGWGNLANGLKARYLLSMEDYPGALAAAQAANFTVASDDVSIVHSTDNNAENLFYQFEEEQRGGYLTFGDSYLYRTIADTLENYIDTVFIDTTYLDDEQTMIDEITERPFTALKRATNKTNDAARLAFFAAGEDLNISPTGFFGAASNYPVISTPEVQLIIAEAAARGGDRTTAIQALNTARNYWDERTGVDNYLDLTEDDFEEEDMDDDGNPIVSNNLLEMILLEKFISVFGPTTLQDIVRTNNAINTDLDGRTMPAQRFLYPATEASSNANYPGLKTLDDPTPINE